MLIVVEVLGGPLCKMQVLWLGVYDAGEDGGRASVLLRPRIAARKLLTALPSTTYGGEDKSRGQVSAHIHGRKWW